MTPADTSPPIGVYATPDQADQVDQQFQQVANSNQSLNDFADQVNQHLIDQGAQWAQFQQMAAGHLSGMQDAFSSFQNMVQQHVSSPAGQATADAVRVGADPDNLARMRTLMSEKDYTNLCEQLVENSEGTTGQYPSAAAAAQAKQGQMRTDFENAQPGDEVYYGAAPENGGNGHAALYAGNGTVLSSAAKDPTPLSGYFNAPLLGYVPRGQQQPTPAPAPTPTTDDKQGPRTGMQDASNPTLADQTGIMDQLNNIPSWGPLSAGASASGEPPVDTGPSPSDQQTPVAQYNQQTPGGGFEQVTKMASGDYNAQPTDQPSADQQAVYDAQNAATNGFSSPEVNVPLLADSTPGAQQAVPAAAPEQPPAEAQAAPGALGGAPLTDASQFGAAPGQPPVPTAAQPDIKGMLADALHQVADAIGGRAQAAVQGAEQAATRDVGTNLTGNEGFGDLVDKAGNIIAGGIAGAVGAKGSDSLPPDTVAPGHLEDPYTNTGLSKVPVVGGAISGALNPANYIPIGGEAIAGEDALRSVAEAAGEFAKSDVARSLPAMAGGAMNASQPTLLGRVADAVAGKTLAPDEMANRVANAIQQFMSSPNLAGVKNVRGALTMNAGAKASWDVASDYLASALEQALPDAADRARIVTEFNDPAARATWTPDMQYWADYWTKAEQNTSAIAKQTGVIQNMLPDYMARLARKPDGSPVEASAFSDYVGASKQRTMPTYQDFADAIRAKGMEPMTDLADVMRAKISSLGNAIENSRLGSYLESMPAKDGNPVLAKQRAIGKTFNGQIILGNKTMPGYTNVHIPGMGDRLVNNTAVADLQDLIKPVLDNPVFDALARFNRGIQWGIMYNPVIHARNVLTPAMAGSGGWDALAAGVPVWRQGMDMMRSKPEDVLELVRGGLSLTANREARQAAIDAIIERSPDTNVVGGLASKIPARAGLDHLLWDGIVQPWQVGTAARLRDQFLAKGLSRDDAVKAAAEAANTMFGQVPAATLARVQRQAGSLLLFAKNWTFGNLRVARYATYNLPGHQLAARVGGDRVTAALGNAMRNVSPVAGHLTPDAEAAVADAARKYLVRAFVQGAVSHAAMNYALTGHDQFDNGPNHALDLGWKDDKGVEHYSAYPFYKQEQDYMGYAGAFGKNPVRTVLNRVAPALSTAAEAGEPFLNPRDAGQDGPLLHALKVGIHNFAPFGVGNLVNPNPTRQTPDQPAVLDVLGTNAKTESSGSSRGSGKPGPPRISVRR